MNVLKKSERTTLAARTRRSLWRLLALATAILVAAPAMAVTTASPATAAADDGILRVLLFYKTNFHASHVQARQAVNELAQELATQHGQVLQVEETDNPAAFNADNLATHDAVVFAQTGGVLFNTEQREALEDYIRGAAATWVFTTRPGRPAPSASTT
ncbi:ThuA domain-containing protein [Microbacterium sp. NIBRBAC000506063]|uniref:ThuA domain-containing protein n=1 Tax=Microbacterium sp. NIBRBAC000506063 TaxID=2734618 RepID=UPI001BB80053|nr:ThuA domain-containing protein [Microbacterium sp. NIBRBAC000506063]QTV80402.1 ThuA domain-containing protein [Microbacterium sp. NIBRBAC000506063]